jgi:hypothetical protein
MIEYLKYHKGAFLFIFLGAIPSAIYAYVCFEKSDMKNLFGALFGTLLFCVFAYLDLTKGREWIAKKLDPYF